MLSLSFVPAYAFSHDKTLIILFKDVNENPVYFADCAIQTNDHTFYTLTDHRGMAWANVTGENYSISVECSNDVSVEAECDVFLKRGVNILVLEDNSDSTLSSCN